MEAYHSKYKRAVSDGNVPDIEIACQNLLDDNEARIIENTVLSQKVPKRRKAVVDDNQSPGKKLKKKQKNQVWMLRNQKKRKLEKQMG